MGHRAVRAEPFLVVLFAADGAFSVLATVKSLKCSEAGAMEEMAAVKNDLLLEAEYFLTNGTRLLMVLPLAGLRLHLMAVAQLCPHDRASVLALAWQLYILSLHLLPPNFCERGWRSFHQASFLRQRELRIVRKLVGLRSGSFGTASGTASNSATVHERACLACPASFRTPGPRHRWRATLPHANSHF